jgi:hypothetical protein
MGLGGVDRIGLIQHRAKRRALVNAAMNLLATQLVGSRVVLTFVQF